MSAAITAAVGGAVVGGIISSRAQSAAAKKAASAQISSAEMGIEFQREQLAEQQRQFDLQMQEYRRKQEMLENNYAEMKQNLAPYIQAGQGALFEQMALAGVAAPASPITTTAPTAPTVPSVAGPYMPGIRQEGAPATVTRDLGAAKPTGGFGGGLTGAGAGVASTVMGEVLRRQQQGTQPQVGARANEADVQRRRQLIAAGFTKDQVDRMVPLQEQPAPATEVVGTGTGEKAGLSGMAGLLRPVADIMQGQIQPAAEQIVANRQEIASPYAGMTGEEAQAAAIEKISQSPILQALMQQGEEAMLQQAAATGGLRGGNIQGALAQYRPQMLQQAIEQQYARLGGLAATGQQSILQTPTVQPGSMPSYGGMDTSIANLMGTIGEAQAAQAIAQGQAQGQLWGGIGQGAGLALGSYLNRPQTSNPYTGQAGMQAVYNTDGTISYYPG